MKKLIILLLFVVGVLFSQDNKNNSSVINNKSSSTSEQTEQKVVVVEQLLNDSIDASQPNGYTIKKLSGEHKYGGVTQIEYKSLAQLLNEAKKDSEKQMWTKEKTQSILESLKRRCKGGYIRLYIERITIGSANTKMFSIIIKDTVENELYRIELKDNIPQYSSDNWRNYGLAYIDKMIKPPFYVYIVDGIADAPFKFEVTAIKK